MNPHYHVELDYRPESERNMTGHDVSELVIMQSYYHQRPRKEPSVIGNGTHTVTRMLTTNLPSHVYEDVAQRQWKKIGYVSLKDSEVATIIVRNDEGQFYETIPSEEQKREMSQRVIDIQFGHDPVSTLGHLYVLPKEQQALNVCHGVGIWIRSRSGSDLNCTIMVIPR